MSEKGHVTIQTFVPDSRVRNGYQGFSSLTPEQIQGFQSLYHAYNQAIDNEPYEDRQLGFSQGFQYELWSGIVLASIDGKPVGYATFGEDQEEDLNGVIFLEAYIDGEHRNLGIFPQMHDVVIQYAHEIGADAIWLQLFDIGNSRYQESLRRLGYQEDTIEPHAEGFWRKEF